MRAWGSWHGLTRNNKLHPSVTWCAATHESHRHSDHPTPQVTKVCAALCGCSHMQKPLLDQVPTLKVVMEHITTADAAHFVAGAPANVAASVTPQHMLLNRNALFAVSGCGLWAC